MVHTTTDTTAVDTQNLKTYPRQRYCEPYFLYDQDPDDPDAEQELGVACPVCGDPSDYCLDHHHWLCETHTDVSLEINKDDSDDAFWECPECPEQLTH